MSALANVRIFLARAQMGDCNDRCQYPMFFNYFGVNGMFSLEKWNNFERNPENRCLNVQTMFSKDR